MKQIQLGILLLAGLTFAFGQADNTKKNKRDRTDHAITADQQGENEADRELTRKIRKSLTYDSGQSTYAKNVKVVSSGGKVTLRGPVNSEAEKTKIGVHANAAAGKDNVSNLLEIVAKGEGK